MRPASRRLYTGTQFALDFNLEYCGHRGEVDNMPKGHAARREKKKTKKKVDKPVTMTTAVFTSPEVDVVKRKRKPREEED